MEQEVGITLGNSPWHCHGIDGNGDGVWNADESGSGDVDAEGDKDEDVDGMGRQMLTGMGMWM